MLGLKQRILSATSIDEVSKLLKDGTTYEFASVKTKNSWVNAAKRNAAGMKYIITAITEKPAKKKKTRARRSR